MESVREYGQFDKPKELIRFENGQGPFKSHSVFYPVIIICFAHAEKSACSATAHAGIICFDCAVPKSANIISAKTSVSLSACCFFMHNTV